jgi:hypothetical protein
VECAYRDPVFEILSHVTDQILIHLFRFTSYTTYLTVDFFRFQTSIAIHDLQAIFLLILFEVEIEISSIDGRRIRIVNSRAIENLESVIESATLSMFSIVLICSGC